MIQKKSKKIILVSVLCIALSAVGVGLLFFGVLSKKKEQTLPLPEPVARVEQREYFRILVAGSDATSGLCDVLMLLSLDRETKEVFVLQIPRDTYAAYTEKSYRKLNGAYAELGGMAGLAEFLSGALGVTIDRTLHLSPSTFRTMVDAIGGVEIELPMDLDYEDPAQGLSIHLKEGKQTLDGKAAEQFVRYRSGYAQGDLDRLDAQKLFLSALFGKVTQMGAFHVAKLAMSLKKEVETDVSVTDILLLANELLSISAEHVYFVTAPGEATTATKSGASYYVLSASATEELLVLYFGAEQGSFDRNRVFCNPSYQHFVEIYEKHCEYLLQPCA